MCQPDKHGFFFGGKNGRQVKSHQFALFTKTRRFGGPDEMSIHSCDNPPCCNPKHTRWGTDLDNKRDRLARGEFICWFTANPEARPRGVKHAKSILTDKDVKTMRRLRENGTRVVDIQRLHFPYINYFTIWSAINEHWKHVV